MWHRVEDKLPTIESYGESGALLCTIHKHGLPIVARYDHFDNIWYKEEYGTPSSPGRAIVLVIA